MDIEFVAGFGPIGTGDARSVEFWSGALGIAFHEPAPGYRTTESLAGVKVFAIWPLDQAAESTFGTTEWPAGLLIPQSWIEFDVASPEEVEAAASELIAGGHALLRPTQLEPWGQWTCRLQSPEGMLVGIAHTPWLHDEGSAD